MAVYFEKIMRLFEQVPAPLYVVKIAKSATLFMEKRDPRSVSDEVVHFRGFK